MKTEKPAGSDFSTDYIPEILYEDNHVIAVNKPAGMLTQGDASGEVSLLEYIKRYIKKRDHKPGNVYLGMVQRLDKPVSGVVIFAKTSKGAKRISEQIRNRQVLKYYVAVTPSAGAWSSTDEWHFDSGWCEIRDQLKRTGSRTIVCKTAEEGSQSAILRIKTVFANNDFQLHLIRLITGRKHQIRAQLSERRMPIHGDGKYGAKTNLAPGRILLHSYFVKLVHPTRRNDLVVNCPPTSDVLFVYNDAEQAQIELQLSRLIDLPSIG